MDFTIASDDPIGPKVLRLWAYERRLLIDHKRRPDTAGERALIAHARALADEWEGKGKAPPAFLQKPKRPQDAPEKRGVLARLFGRK